MNLRARMRTPGMVGMCAAVLFLAALFVEYAFGLFPPGDGSAPYYFDQALFFIAQIGFLILLLELRRAKVAGYGIFGKIALGIFFSGLIALLIAQAVSLLTNNPDFLLFPIGGLLQFIGCLLTGIVVVTAKRWEGWQRFVPLLQSIYLLLAIMLPIFIANQSPTLLTESLWQVTWFLVGLALFTQAGRLQQGNMLSTYL
jgi:hypothetical protein